MQIKRLRIAGFKSFVDPADLRIEPGLTGVVGPNGCGKSNLLEALRWTMGETSAKSMRGAGMEDVIFAGTATRPERDFAEVSLLAELDGPEGVRETEVVRRIERGAGSAYRIDGRDVRARDVALLFADAATGAHSPALVSQGRIGAVIAARPAERRAMLEEAAGIAGLHVRRKDAETRLRATEVNLQRLDEVIADQATRVAGLCRQARAAGRYRDLSERIQVAEARLIYARWHAAKAAADVAMQEAATAEAAVIGAADAQRAAAAWQRDAAATVAEARAAALAARDRASEAGHALATLRAEAAAAARQLAEATQALARLADDRAGEGALANDAAAALAQLNEAVRTAEAEVAAAAGDRPALDLALAAAERDARDAEVALAQAHAAQSGEAADARVAQAALAAARTRADRARRDAATAAAALAALGEAAPLERARDDGARARDTAAAAGAAATTALAAAEQVERDGLAARDTAQAAAATARAELAAIDGEAAALDRATRSSGGDALLDRVVAAPGYERALAAALGDDLQAGLDARADRHWAGAAPMADDPGTPAGTEPLAPHVTAPPALARRLAQVFVAHSDSGQPLAVGQRLVTPSGVLRRWDGFVARAGGAAAAARLERQNRLAALAAARPDVAAVATAADAALAGADAAVSAARTAAQAARTERARADAAARDAQGREDRAAAALERLAGQRADLRTRAERADRELGDAESEAARAGEGVAALPDGRVTAARVATLARETDARRAAMAAARSALAVLDARASAARERLAGHQAEARGWRARAGEAAKRIAAMAAREAELTRAAEALAGRPEALAAEVEAAAADHDAARASAQALAAAEHAADAALRTADAAAHEAGEALAQAREARAGAAARAESHALRRVELGRVAGERFGCPAAALPERVGFVAAEVADAAAESSTHDTLLRERERIGPVNLVAERELAELEATGAGNAAERDELAQAIARLRGSIGTLNREGRQRLLAAFQAVDGHFRRLFTTLFSGGQAHLELVDSDDPLEAGLEIMAQPPGKRLQSLMLLSGGEQALTAVALIFGLFLTNPAPICVLDEVDAPLDDANIERFCDLLDRMRRETATRYLIVTHNAVTMSRMDRLFGVTMIERGVSRLVSVDLQAAETLLAAE